jgi:hypothetical protein
MILPPFSFLDSQKIYTFFPDHQPGIQKRPLLECRANLFTGSDASLDLHMLKSKSWLQDGTAANHLFFSRMVVLEIPYIFFSSPYVYHFKYSRMV